MASVASHDQRVAMAGGYLDRLMPTLVWLREENSAVEPPPPLEPEAVLAIAQAYARKHGAAPWRAHRMAAVSGMRRYASWLGSM